MSEEPGTCPNVDRCELFPRFKLEAALSFCLESYCHSEFTRCARYQHVQEHKQRPPSDLLPNGKRLVVLGQDDG